MNARLYSYDEFVRSIGTTFRREYFQGLVSLPFLGRTYPEWRIQNCTIARVAPPLARPPIYGVAIGEGHVDDFKLKYKIAKSTLCNFSSPYDPLLTLVGPYISFASAVDQSKAWRLHLYTATSAPTSKHPLKFRHG